jgi:NADP-dependent 3-hydroxy acid dehydrogenase YdfG
VSRLAGQTVLVSGASSGIGAACAELLAHAGVRLILLARRMAKLQVVADRCIAAGAAAYKNLINLTQSRKSLRYTF